MFEKIDVKSSGNYYTVCCEGLNSTEVKLIERFCREKLKAGVNPDTGFVINTRYEIKYLTIKEIHDNYLTKTNNVSCEYQLEF